MRIHLVAKVLIAAMPAVALSPVAHAEIYTWVDAQGRTNISNLAPPDGARVTKVVREAPPNPYNDAAREAAQKAEMEALAQRIDQLQNALQIAARQPPPPPQPQVIVVPMAAPAQYVPEPQPAPQVPDCSYGWSCNGWWNPGFPPFVSYVYVPVPSRNRFPSHHVGPGGRGDRGGDQGVPRRPPMKTVAMNRS